MQPYLKKAVSVVTDSNQTSYSKQLARDLLKNAGYSDEDIRSLVSGEKQPEDLYFILA